MAGAGEASSAQPPQEGASDASTTPGPIVVLMVGMAGSGKTSLVQRIGAYLNERQAQPYIINLDPAVTILPYGAHVDARDTVDYKKVMEEYGLGPNGGIMTSCNLFATRFDQVMDLIKKREAETDYVIVDTPGQIEMFTWSASGEIITQAFASRYRTMVVFVLDTTRCVNPQRFMSNMLQAVSVTYRSKLPVAIAFNKTDVARHDFALEWMRDLDTYQAALDEVTSFAADLSRSLALVLDEFYSSLPAVGTSAATGEGMDDFFEGVKTAAKKYDRSFKPSRESDNESRVRDFPLLRCIHRFFGNFTFRLPFSFRSLGVGEFAGFGAS